MTGVQTCALPISNPVNHLKVSLVKSAFRLLGLALIIFLNINGLQAGAVLLALAELFGVIEELV